MSEQFSSRKTKRSSGADGKSSPFDALSIQVASPAVPIGPHPEIAGITIADIQLQFEAKTLTSVSLTRIYLDRIRELDQDGPLLRSVIEINPDALDIAAGLDAERADGQVRSKLHGVPILLKDNIDTADSMHTTAGSVALMKSTPSQDATVTKQLRDAGAVILGKTNLSEWANFRGHNSSSGWSSRGGQTRNPVSLGRSPSGSSSGSAVAVAADLAVVTIGTETNGSIITPASACGVVGFKPTVGLTSRAGVIPISHSQDSVGVFGRSVADVASTISLLTGVDKRDSATVASASIADTDFSASLTQESLRGVRLGVPTNAKFLGYSAKTDALFAAVLETLASLGAEIVGDFVMPGAEALAERPGEIDRMLYEFKRDLNAYLVLRGDPDIRSLTDLLAFNNQHADVVLRHFGQENFVLAEATQDDEAAYATLDARLRRLSKDEGIDAVLDEYQLDALIAPAMAPARLIDLALGQGFLGSSTSLAAVAGYPMVTVPAGFIHGLPVGLAFIGRAWSDASLLNLAYAWEQATHMYRSPRFSQEDIASLPETPPFEFPPARRMQR